MALNPCTIVYDKTKAKTPVTSWKDMWNPEWKGRIAWPTGVGAEGVLTQTALNEALHHQHELQPDIRDLLQATRARIPALAQANLAARTA